MAYHAATLTTIWLLMGGCTLTKWTTDSVANFTSSTSPGNLFTPDGLIQEQQRATVFTAMNFDNLRQDIAQGHGEYLTSLSALLQIPREHQDDFFALLQQQYPVLYASGNVAPADTLAALRRVWTQHEFRVNSLSASWAGGASAPPIVRLGH